MLCVTFYDRKQFKIIINTKYCLVYIMSVKITVLLFNFNKFCNLYNFVKTFICIYISTKFFSAVVASISTSHAYPRCPHLIPHHHASPTPTGLGTAPPRAHPIQSLGDSSRSSYRLRATVP